MVPRPPTEACDDHGTRPARRNHAAWLWLLASKTFLRKAYEALPAGAVIAYDALIDDERRESAFGLLMSLNVLIETPGGFDYTGADCVAWMREAGFRDCRVERLTPTHGMVVGLK